MKSEVEIAENLALTQRGSENVQAAREGMKEGIEKLGLGFEGPLAMPREWNLAFSPEITFITQDGEMAVSPIRPMVYENDEWVIVTSIAAMPKSRMQLMTPEGVDA